MKRWTLVVALASLVVFGCDDGAGDDGGAGLSQTTVDFDAFVAASQASEDQDTVVEQAEIDPDVVEYVGTDTVSAGLEQPDAEGGLGGPEYQMCNEETFFNACEECVCAECGPLAESCGKSEGCMALTSCGMQTGCIGVMCIEACSDVMAEYGGAVGKAADMATKLSGCLLQKCFAQCSGGIGSDPFNPEDGEGEGN